MSHSLRNSTGVVILFAAGIALGFGWNALTEPRGRSTEKTDVSPQPEPEPTPPADAAPDEPAGSTAVAAELVEALRRLPRPAKRPPAGDILGLVQGATGEPRPGITVRLRVSGSPPGDSPIAVESNDLVEYVRRRVSHHDFTRQNSWAEVTDANGRFVFTGVGNHYYRLSVTPEHRVLVDGRATSFAVPGSDVEITLLPPKPAARSVRIELTATDGPVDSAQLVLTSGLDTDWGNWSARSPSVEIPPEVYAITVNAPHRPPAYVEIPAVLPETLTIPLDPECGVELFVSLPPSADLDPRRAQQPVYGRDGPGTTVTPYFVYWRGADRNSAVDDALLLADGIRQQATSRETTIAPLVPGAYWIGVSRTEGVIEWARSIEVSTGFTRVEVSELATTEPDMLLVTLDSGFDLDLGQLQLTLRDVSRDNELGSNDTAIMSSEHRLALSPIASAILDGTLTGDLELVVQAPGLRSQVPVTSRNVFVSLERAAVLTVDIRGFSGSESLSVSLHEESDRWGWSSAIHREASAESPTVRLRAQPGKYVLRVDDNETGSTRATESVTLVEGQQSLSIALAPTHVLSIRVPDGYDTLVVQGLDGSGNDHVELSGAGQYETRPLAAGRYMVMLLRDGERSYMTVTHEGPSTIDFRAMNFNGVRLTQDLSENVPLQKDDVIIGIAGQRFQGLDDLETQFEQAFFSGPMIEFLVLRGETELEVEMSLEEFDDHAGPMGWEPVEVP